MYTSIQEEEEFLETHTADPAFFLPRFYLSFYLSFIQGRKRRRRRNSNDSSDELCDNLSCPEFPGNSYTNYDYTQANLLLYYAACSALLCRL